MPYRFKSQHRALLAIDIRADQLTVLQFSIGSPPCIEHYATTYLPEGVICGCVITDIPYVAHCLRQLLLRAQCTSSAAVCAIHESLVTTSVMKVPKILTDLEAEAWVLGELAKRLSYAFDELYVDFHVITPALIDASLQNIFVVASRRESVDARVDILTRAGLQVIGVDVEAYAIGRAIPQDLIQKHSVIAVLDVGVASARLLVWQEDSLLFCHEEPFGANSLWHDVMQQGALTRETARSCVDTGVFPFEVSDILLAFQEALWWHVQRALQLFSTQHSVLLSHVILAGNVNSLPNLRLWLQEQSLIPISLANPMAYVKKKNTEIETAVTNNAASLMVMAGLVLAREGLR